MPGPGEAWTFVVLPADVSGALPRRGRLTAQGTLNGQPFSALLEPDGKGSHWLKIGASLLDAARAAPGEQAEFEIEAAAEEPEPDLPTDLAAALDRLPDARATWDATTVLARVDWIHWIESAKRATTRDKRIADACDMLAGGKKRVCCFDPSGVYSKALSAPEPE